MNNNTLKSKINLENVICTDPRKLKENFNNIETNKVKKEFRKLHLITNILFRLIGLIPFAILYFIGLMKRFLIDLIRFVCFGGEYVVYQLTNEKESIADVYTLIKKDHTIASKKIFELEKKCEITNSQLNDAMELAGKQRSFILKNDLYKQWHEYKNTKEDENCEGK